MKTPTTQTAPEAKNSGIAKAKIVDEKLASILLAKAERPEKHGPLFAEFTKSKKHIFLGTVSKKGEYLRLATVEAVKPFLGCNYKQTAIHSLALATEGAADGVNPNNLRFAAVFGSLDV